MAQRQFSNFNSNQQKRGQKKGKQSQRTKRSVIKTIDYDYSIDKTAYLKTHDAFHCFLPISIFYIIGMK